MGNCCHQVDVLDDQENIERVPLIINTTLREKKNPNIAKAFRILDETRIIPWNDKLDNTCPICLETFENMDAVYLTDCVHVYHYECLGLWVVTSPICPICRFHL